MMMRTRKMATTTRRKTIINTITRRKRMTNKNSAW